ncbi:MAG: glycosyltransferase [Patescibacteria group bacterium]|nr:glycosyltransferase [Patescibacteria group bacterium]
MSLSLITFADLGKRKNLKTADILPVIEEFAKREPSTQIVCRMQQGSNLENVKAGVPVYLHYAAKILERLTLRMFSARQWEEKRLDKKASAYLSKSDVVLFHPEYAFPKTIEKARELNSVAVGICTVAHPKLNRETFQEESKILGIDLDVSQWEEKLDADAATVKRLDYVIALSDFVRDSYLNAGFGKEQIFVAYQDIDKNKFIPASKLDNVFRLLYLSHTSPLKGLHYLLDAWTSLGLKNAELVLVGGYAPGIPEELKNRYEKIMSKDPSIIWAGSTQNPLRFYWESSAFVLPSLTEGNPRVIMEALACGIPVITTDRARSIVRDGETGFIVPARDSNALAKRIKSLYDDQEKLAIMSVNARKSIDDKKPFGKEVFEIYQAIMARSVKK